MPKSALLVLDMQKDLCEHPDRKDHVQTALPPLCKAINLFHAADQPIFYICLDLSPDDEQFQRFGDVYCVHGTDGAEIIPELHPLRGRKVAKRKHSAFFETELDKLLCDSGVRDVYLAGLQTQICVMTTAADASFRGYRTVVIRDAVISTRDAAKQEALRWIERYVGEAKWLSEVVDAITG